jgi:hypothetical protein
MIAVYCPEERHEARLHTALAGVNVKRAENWALFTSAVGGCACGVVIVDWLAGNLAVERLEALRVQYPHKPVVLVTRKDADNVRLSHRVRIDELVWTEELEESLPDALERTLKTHSFKEIVGALEVADGLPRRLREALAHLFRSPNVIVTIAALGAAVGCDRRTLWRLWAGTVGSADGPRLQDIIDWNLLLRAIFLRAHASSWVGIAEQLGVHEHTLSRMSKRLTGLDLRGLGTLPPEAVLEMFHSRVLVVLSAAGEMAHG